MTVAPETNGTTPPLHVVAATEPSDAAEAERSPERSSQATRLVELAEARFRFGRDPSGDLFAGPISGPPIVSMLRGAGTSLRTILAEAFNSEYHAAPTANNIAAALNVLEGRARRAEAEPLALRVAELEGKIVLDLGDET